MLVELTEGAAPRAEDAGSVRPQPDAAHDGAAAAPAADRTSQRRRSAGGGAAGRRRPSRASPTAIREVRRLFQAAQNPPRWPMYIRQAKQFLRNVDATFDERKFGFASLVDLLRACQRDGLFRIERDRQGVMRIFPGNVMQVRRRAGDDRAGGH